MLCLFIEGDGIAHGYHPYRLIACRQTPAESWFHKPRSQSMERQDRGRGLRRLQHVHGTAMKDGAPRLTRFSVDHRTDLRVCEQVAPISYVLSLALRLVQQMALQHLVQSRKPIMFGEIGHLTQVLKGDSLTQDGSCHQQRKGVRRKSIKPGADDFAHTGWEEPTYHHLMLHGCRKVNRPSSLFVWAGGERATFKQDLERFHQIERLPLGFRKKPLAKAFQVSCSLLVFASFSPECLEQAQDVFGGERAKLQMGQRHGAFDISSPLGECGSHSFLSPAQRQEQERRGLALREAPCEVMQHVE